MQVVCSLCGTEQEVSLDFLLSFSVIFHNGMLIGTNKEKKFNVYRNYKILYKIGTPISAKVSFILRT